MNHPLNENAYLPLYYFNGIKATRCFIYNWVLTPGLEDLILVLISRVLLF